MRSTTTTFIRRHVFSLPLGRIFTTRDLLGYGRRSAVDQAVSRLVKSSTIVRLARGVFIRTGSPIPDTFEIARAKAEAFGKQIAAHAGKLAFDLGLTAKALAEPAFAVNAGSSSFQAGPVRIHLKKTAHRKLHLGDRPAGRALRALWHVGKKMVDGACLTSATARLGRTDRAEIRQAASLLPAWLMLHFLRD